MKKIIFISTIIVLLGLAGYVFIAQRSVNREILQVTPQKPAEAPPQPPAAAAFDTNDNLDQALQDLDQVE